ncbi:hypothetical protein M885DRAFT_622163 [Pelagophyceae sp. CCMP2097]|nr:hypothetical protein M885DRAFT_622163 [Pelagophyceae sp. CCMP2097]
MPTKANVQKALDEAMETQHLANLQIEEQKQLIAVLTAAAASLTVAASASASTAAASAQEAPSDLAPSATTSNVEAKGDPAMRLGLPTATPAATPPRRSALKLDTVVTALAGTSLAMTQEPDADREKVRTLFRILAQFDEKLNGLTAPLFDVKAVRTDGDLNRDLGLALTVIAARESVLSNITNTCTPGDGAGMAQALYDAFISRGAGATINVALERLNHLSLAAAGGNIHTFIQAVQASYKAYATVTGTPLTDAFKTHYFLKGVDTNYMAIVKNEWQRKETPFDAMVNELRQLRAAKLPAPVFALTPAAQPWPAPAVATLALQHVTPPSIAAKEMADKAQCHFCGHLNHSANECDKARFHQCSRFP